MSFINMYPAEPVPYIKPALAVSMVTFFLTMMVQSIEMNTFIKGLGILDISSLKRTSVVFAYVSGYFYMFFKIIIALFVVYAMINLIGWVIMGIVHMFTGGDQGGGAIGGAFSAAHLMAGGGAEIGERMKKLAKKTAVYFFGIFFLKDALLTFILIVPLVIIAFSISYSMYVDKDIIEDRHEMQKERIATTNHNFMVYIIVTMYVFITLYLCVPYLIKPICPPS